MCRVVIKNYIKKNIKKNSESQNWFRFCKIIFQNDSFVSSHIDKIFNQLKCFNNLSISMNWTWYIVIKQMVYFTFIVQWGKNLYKKKSHRTFFHSFETNPRRSCLDMMLSYELQTILPTKKLSGRKQLKRDNGGIYKVIKWFIAQHLVFGGVVLSGKLRWWAIFV